MVLIFILTVLIVIMITLVSIFNTLNAMAADTNYACNTIVEWYNVWRDR